MMKPAFYVLGMVMFVQAGTQGSKQVRVLCAGNEWEVQLTESCGPVTQRLQKALVSVQTLTDLPDLYRRMERMRF
jgi:hypothetical protein